MIHSSTITLVVAAIGIASSMALPFEENDLRAVTNSEPQNSQSTLSSGTYSSGPVGHPSSSPGAHSTGSGTLSFGPRPDITSTFHTSGSPGGTKTHHGSPYQTTTRHHTVTSVPHCHGHGNGSSMNGGHGGGYENHSRSPGHHSSYLGAPPLSGSAKPTIHKTSMNRRMVTASSSESGLPTHTIESGVPSASVSATHQSGGQVPHTMRPANSTTSIISKHGGEPTRCPTAGDKPGSKGGHSGGDGDDGGHGKGDEHNEHRNGGHKGSQESMSAYPTPTQEGHHGHQGASSANAAPTHGATSSGNPDPVQTMRQRNMFRREPSLDELD